MDYDIEDFKSIRDIVRIFENVGEWFHHVYPERHIYTNLDVDYLKERITFLTRIEYEKDLYKDMGTFVTFDQANGKDLSFTLNVKNRLFDSLTKAIREGMVPNPHIGKTTNE